MFRCKFCNYESLILSTYLEHLKEHSGLTKKLICGYNGCNKAYSNLKSLQSHTYRFHQYKSNKAVLPSTNANNEVPLEIIHCTVENCTQKYTNKTEIIKHLKEHIEDGMTITCFYPNCEKKYHISSSFASHISKFQKKKQAHLSQLLNNSNVHYSEPIIIDDDNLINEPSLPEYQAENNNLDSEKEIFSEDIFLMNLAHFFLKLEFKFCLPASTVQFIATEITTITQQNTKVFKQNIPKHLEQLGLSEASIEDIIKNTLDNKMLDIDDRLGTIFKRRKFYEQNFPYVSPIQVPLDSVNNKKRFFHYVPLQDTLKYLFNNKSLGDKLSFDLPKSNSDVFKDFTDGSVFKNNPFFQENPDALKLRLYQDSFEIVNPLGSAKSKYKILAVYLSIGNYPDNIRSHVNSMYLVALCREKLFDPAKVFGRIVKDLKEIETNGIKLSSQKVIKGSLVFVTGDNLGSHMLGGFAENFSRNQYFCRYCLVTKKSFETKDGFMKSYPARTIQSYEKVIDRLNKKKNVLSTKKKPILNKPLIIEGIKRNSVFNKLNFYHVCLPGLPPCLGHDVFEGVLAYDVKLCLDYLVEEKWFSYKLLNRKIEIFEYSVEDQRDKLCSISATSSKLSGGACQMWNFLRLLPLLIHDKIDDIEDDVWISILLLTEIIEIICAPAIHETCITYLDTLIRDYIYLRKSLFDQPLRPKHHYLTHYPSLILQFGPLMKSWTLRSESKHCFMKRSMRYLRNFINVTKSLSIKHEMYQCFVRLGGEMSSDVECKSCEKFNLNLYNEKIKNALSHMLLSQDIMECSEITKNGISYRTGDGLFIDRGGYQYKIVIGRICKMLYDEIEIYFILEVMQTEFIPYLRAFKVVELSQYKCLSFKELISFEKLHIYKISSNQYVKPKYGLVEFGL